MGDKSLAIQKRLATIDVTKLVDYTVKVRDIGSLNNMMAPVYLRDFITAYDVTNTMLSMAVRCEANASSELDTAKAIAYLDRAGDYLKDHGIKDSAEARKRYVDIDDDVKEAEELRAKTLAIVVFLKNKLRVFQDAQNAVKKVAYSSEFQNNSPFEGM